MPRSPAASSGAHARRVADGDIEALPGLLQLLVRSGGRHR